MPRTILVCALAAVLLSVTGCGGSKSATQSGAAQYRRSPIVEVAEKQLSQDALLIDAKTQQELGNHDEALASYRRLLQQNPDYGAACYGMSQLMASTGRVDSARYYAERAVQTDDSNVWYHLWVAQIYQLTGNTRQLVETWEKLVSLEPEKVEYYYELSNSYIAAGKAGAAISYALGQGAPMIAALWGVFVWKEFKGADAKTNGYLAIMFIFFIAGLAMIVFAGR